MAAPPRAAPLPDDPRQLELEVGDESNGEEDPFETVEEFNTVVGAVEPVDEDEAEVRAGGGGQGVGWGGLRALGYALGDRSPALSRIMLC